MSSSSVSKKHAVSSAETGTTNDGGADGPSSQYKRMRLEDIIDVDRKPSADPHKDLELAFQRKAKALADLEAAQHDIAKARRDIRARGESEFDSLLVVGNDSVSHILSYVDVKQLCRCEMTCKAFQRLSIDGWRGLDKRITNKSTVANSPKQRCVRHVRALEYAQKMEQYASSHSWSDYEIICRDSDVRYNDSSEYDCCDQLKNEVWGCDDNDDDLCESSVLCGFPDQLAVVDKSERELFLLVRGISGSVLIEGFFPLRCLQGGRRNGKHCLDLSSAHCPNWPELETLLSHQLSEQDEWGKKWDERGFEAIATVTLIRLTKYDAPRLVASVDEFIYVNQEDEASEEEDDPWHPTFSGKNPMKPHYFETEEMVVKSRAVEFGWCQNRKVIGFCLVERQHIYDDPQDIMPSP